MGPLLGEQEMCLRDPEIKQKAMKERGSSGDAKRRQVQPKPALPIPWQSIPHRKIWQRALDKRGDGSKDRAAEDAKRHVLKRRLPELRSEDHSRYLEIECAGSVEAVRILRDQYREELTQLGCKPISEMYWVVFRYAIIPAAAAFLRKAAAQYIIATKIDKERWTRLYGFQALPLTGANGRLGSVPVVPSDELWQEGVVRTVNSVISDDALSEITFRGGPFGKEAQVRWARRAPWLERTIKGKITMLEEIVLRKKLWDACKPWTDGLTRLWDAAQEELEEEYRALSEDSRRAELEYVNVTPFEEIVHKQLKAERHSKVPRSRVSPESWLALARELDKRKCSLDKELRGGGPGGGLPCQTKRQAHRDLGGFVKPAPSDDVGEW